MKQSRELIIKNIIFLAALSFIVTLAMSGIWLLFPSQFLLNNDWQGYFFPWFNLTQGGTIECAPNVTSCSGGFVLNINHNWINFITSIAIVMLFLSILQLYVNRWVKPKSNFQGG